MCAAVVGAACSRAGETTTTTVATTVPPETTTTVLATTTTVTVGGVEVKGDLDEGLLAATAGLYSWMHDHRNPRPDIPTLLWLDLLHVTRPATPVTAAGVVADLDSGDSVAVVHAGEDVLLAVADPQWRIVGADLADGDPWFGGPPRKLLVVGSDARPGENQQRLRADSIHIVTVVPSEGGAIFGFPRDSWVPSPAGTMKFTNVMAGRGPDVLLETAEDLTGLDLEGYVVTGFKGFEGLIGELGGLLIDLPRAINSGVAEWGNYPAGKQELSPLRTLRLARIRKTLSGGDLARSANQGLIMLAAMQMVAGMGIDALPGMVKVLLSNAWTDLSTEDLLTFAASIFTVSPDDMANEVAPGTVGSVSGQSVVFLSSSASDSYEDLADGLLGN
jgi:polyisoprenyl-teichoic acid--peptidoglycan teichoic acid transferase